MPSLLVYCRTSDTGLTSAARKTPGERESAMAGKALSKRHGAAPWLMAAALLAVGLAVATLLLTRSAERDRATGSDGLDATQSGCLRTGTLDSVDEVNAFVQKVRGDAAFAGGDVGASVQLQDGRRLFVFGDTLRAADFDGQKFVHNSMLVFSPGCGRVVVPADRGALIPDRSDGVGYWPMSIARVEHEGYDLVGVSVQRVQRTGGSDIFSFRILGPAAALFKVPRGGTPQLESVRDIGPDSVSTQRPMWGAAAVVDGGWVYLYGTSRSEGATTGGFALSVARVRPDHLLDTSQWTYWNGRSWDRRSRRAQILIPARGGVSETLSVFRRGSVWYAVSKRDEVLGQDLTIWRAPGPTGPFTAAPVVAKIPSDAVTGTLRYMPLAHPDLLPQPGSVVVSYSENNTDFATVQDDPRRYRPRFLRVALPD